MHHPTEDKDIAVLLKKKRYDIDKKLTELEKL